LMITTNLFSDFQILKPSKTNVLRGFFVLKTIHNSLKKCGYFITVNSNKTNIFECYRFFIFMLINLKVNHLKIR